MLRKKGRNFVSKTLKYKTILINDPEYIGIDTISNVWDKIKPFAVFLASNNTKINTPLNVICIECLLEIGIFPPGDENNYIGLISTHGYIYDGVVYFREPDFFYRNALYINNNSNYSYSEPVEIIIEARFSYGTEELLQRVLQEEEEEEGEDITIEKKIINTTQTFK